MQNYAGTMLETSGRHVMSSIDFFIYYVCELGKAYAHAFKVAIYTNVM